jgi:23S rRNA-/tRNA-specific pseudouridylate synthase
MQLMPAGKCVAITKNRRRSTVSRVSASFNRDANQRFSIFKMAEVSKNSVTQAIVTEDEARAAPRQLSPEICKGVPKSHVYRIVRSGEVRVNSKRVDASYRLQKGDVLRIPPIRIASAPTTIVLPARDSMLICRSSFEDDALLVVDKPAGIAVHGGSGVSFGVIEALRRQRPQAGFSNWRTDSGSRNLGDPSGWQESALP